LWRQFAWIQVLSDENSRRSGTQVQRVMVADQRELNVPKYWSKKEGEVRWQAGAGCAMS